MRPIKRVEEHGRGWSRTLINRRRTTNRGNEKGQGLVEMSFVLPFVLVLVLGVVEVADSLQAYITVVDSARDGARLGSKNVATNAEIKNLVMTETEKLRDDVQPNDISISYLTVDGEDAIRVQVCNDRTLLLDIPIIMPDSFRMCSATTMRLFSS